jgi:squalene-hopene/tetraprenyl-beta-curcumene cyclase
MSPEQANTQFSATKYSAPRFGRLDADLADVESSIVRSREYLLSRQHTDGYWCGELEADSMLEADYIYLHTQLESGDPGRLKRAFTRTRTAVGAYIPAVRAISRSPSSAISPPS